MAEAAAFATIYRGWMMKPEMYSDFYKLLEQKGIYLINTPEEYERYHTLPGWHDDFAEETRSQYGRLREILKIYC